MLSPARRRLSSALLGVAILGGVASTVLSILLLVAGTSLTGKDEQGRPSGILLKDLSLVSFDGIVADNETSVFLVHMHLFVSAFAWEYPTAPASVPAAGIISSGPRLDYNNLDDFRTIATQLRLPRDTWDCPTPGRAGEACSNLFFEAWRSFFRDAIAGKTAIVTWVMLVAAVLISTLTLVQEIIIKRKPYWMRCRCFAMKKYCPCPDGTKESIEALDEHAWDQVRLAYWGLVMLYFALPVFHTHISVYFFKEYLSHFNNRLPEAMDLNMRKGSGLNDSLWGILLASAVSFVCVLAKWWMSRRARGWMEERALAELQVDEEQGSEEHSDDRSPNYRD